MSKVIWNGQEYDRAPPEMMAEMHGGELPKTFKTSGAQKPTVGRQVHYYGALSADQRGNTGPFAATVVKVNDDGSVNLCVLYAEPPVATFAGSQLLSDILRVGEICERVREEADVALAANRAPCWIWPPRT